MKAVTTGVAAFLLLVAMVPSVQARMAIMFQQREGVVAAIDNNRQMITADYETFALINDQVFAKASQLQGESVHILFYVAEDEKRCVDLRSSEEAAFEIGEPVGK